jgi:hypothetical protein
MRYLAADGRLYMDEAYAMRTWLREVARMRQRVNLTVQTVDEHGNAFAQRFDPQQKAIVPEKTTT